MNAAYTSPFKLLEMNKLLERIQNLAKDIIVSKVSLNELRGGNDHIGTQDVVDT